MPDLSPTLQSFFLAFSALFSIVNPLGAALIFSQVTADRSHSQRVVLAGKIGLYGAIVILCSLWVGAYVLGFFGVSLAALRIAGGFVVASRAWSLLTAPEHNEERKKSEAGHAAGEDDIAFFPLTMPFTTGPGTISVAIALGANRPSGTWVDVDPFFFGVSAAALAVAVTVWIAYGRIRAGRPAQMRRALIERLVADVAAAAAVPPFSVWVYLLELPASAMAEFGRVLPEPGDEAAWAASFPSDERERMTSLAQGT